MLPGLEMTACTDLAVPMEVMQHVVRVESSLNPYAIGVVGGRLVRQPRNLSEAVSTARMLESKGYNFSLGVAQVNRYNLASQGLDSYERAFEVCPNLQAGSRILAECYGRAGGDWGKAFSCYYSGNFSTGFRHGYVQKVFASWQQAQDGAGAGDAIPLAGGARTQPRRAARTVPLVESLLMRRIQDAARPEADAHVFPQTAQQQVPVSQPVQWPQQQMQVPQQMQQASQQTQAPQQMMASQQVQAPALQQFPPAGSRPQPVLLQPDGAPPTTAAVATQPMMGTPAAMPAQALPSQAAWPGNSTQTVGESPPTATGKDEAFVF